MRSDSQAFTKAEVAAAKLLLRFGVEDPRKLHLEDLAMALGIVVIDAPLRGAEARLVRQGEKKGLIRVSEDIPEPGRRRFAIGHELGHWSEHREVSQLSLCTASEVVGYRGSRAELEANAFSANLLLPGRFLRETYPAAPCLDVVQEIAEDLVTTLTATAVRVVETTGDPCLVVFTDLETGCVQWWRRSGRCPQLWLESRQPVSEMSMTSDILAGRDLTPVEEVNPATWFHHVDGHEQYVVYEESMRLGGYPTAITLLSVGTR